MTWVAKSWNYYILGASRNATGNIKKALEQRDAQSKAVKTQRETIEADIQKKIHELHDLLELWKAELISHLGQITQRKLKNLAAQNDEVETVQTQLISVCCLWERVWGQEARERQSWKLRKESWNRLKRWHIIMEPSFQNSCIHHWGRQFIWFNMSPDLRFSASPELAQSFGKFGKLQTSAHVSLEKSYATGKGLELR